MNSVKRLIFYSLVVVAGFALARCTTVMGIKGETLESIYSGVAYLLGIVSGLTLWLVQKWAELSVDEGVRASARKKILIKARARRRAIIIRLAIGICAATTLRIGAALLTNSAKVVSPLWLNISSTAFVLLLTCLLFSYFEYGHLTDFAEQLKRVAEDAKRRAEQLAKLEDTVN